jgi:AcrR family transcriptional regulator
MANIKNNCATVETRRKLIEAAGEIFAKQGLEGATIQAITKRAGTSLAAVNYHFNGKANLYSQVITEANHITTDLLRHLPIEKGKTPQQQLHNYVASMLKLMINGDHTYWHCTLLNREVQNPIRITQKQLKELAQVAHGSLGKLIVRIVGRSINDKELILCTNCIIGLCKYFVDHQDFHANIFPQMPTPRKNCKALTDYITRFCFSAIQQMYGVPAD